MGRLYTLEFYSDFRYGILHGQAPGKTGDDSAGMGLCTHTGYLGSSAGGTGSFWHLKFSGSCVAYRCSGISMAETDAPSVGDVMLGNAFSCVLDSASGRPGSRRAYPAEHTRELLSYPVSLLAGLSRQGLLLNGLFSHITLDFSVLFRSFSW